jgi:hypothetical protein
MSSELYPESDAVSLVSSAVSSSTPTTCRPKFVLRKGNPELVVRTGDEVEFCAPAGQELFICFNNKEFFSVSQITIPKGGCHTFTVKDDRNTLKYEYWVHENTSGYKCPGDAQIAEQGDPSGGGEIGGGS